MLKLTRPRRIVRAAVSLVLALIASVRAGGVALACEIENATPSHAQMPAAMEMNGMAMPSHESAPQSCDEPERSRECALMVACAPATAPRTAVVTSLSTTDAQAIVSPEQSAMTVDRAPEPPPPRA